LARACPYLVNALSRFQVQDDNNMNAFRLLYLVLGWFFVALGVVGIVLPILPTAPFLLLAVWAFSRSSPELAEKIRNHPVAGPLVSAWQDHGVIPLKGKILALLMMAAMGTYTAGFSAAPLWLAITTCVVLIAAAIYVVTRPSRVPA
jgi:uncharacterized protein